MWPSSAAPRNALQVQANVTTCTRTESTTAVNRSLRNVGRTTMSICAYHNNWLPVENRVIQIGDGFNTYFFGTRLCLNNITVGMVSRERITRRNHLSYGLMRNQKTPSAKNE